MSFITKSLILIVTVFVHLEGWAFVQGHGLCTNSAGFRKALSILNQDEDLSYIAKRIRANNTLNEEELNFFIEPINMFLSKMPRCSQQNSQILESSYPQ